ncbi:glycine cleavage system aminomethyltransferase GcvT [Methylomonas koyamae]|uniref:glycine cleavage system aminomethyltransferase GcvT n=1 Tax=Methylomonas koyamae TaxID=702114 RepID=UPI000BC2CEE4|nr:glycine cleavage system aminomethyltransferase GcvT [Methylomonas koyamae]ATG89313.1 glycine cleavage system aminomethyltransferase T [Methylomonas koyamae]
MTNLKLTPLAALHRDLGAKMTAFAGYQMPVQYKNGIIHEHLHCRSQAGFFDISHMGQCRIFGDRAAAALDKLTPGGIAELALGQQKYTVLTNAAGGVIDDIIVTRVTDGVGIIVNAGCKDKDFAYLRERLPADCRFEAFTDRALLALQGPGAAAVMAKFSGEAAALNFLQVCETSVAGVTCSVSRSGYTGEDGFEISLPAADAERVAKLLLAEDGVEPIGLGARDTLRLEAGLCLYGHELNETITPIEAGLNWIFKKGHTDFPGAETILAQRQNAAGRRRVGLLVEGKIPVRDGAILLDSAGREVGIVTSGSFSPTLNRPIAMALIDRALTAAGTRLNAVVRNSAIELTVCPLPFVPHRYHKLAR